MRRSRRFSRSLALASPEGFLSSGLPPRPRSSMKGGRKSPPRGPAPPRPPLGGPLGGRRSSPPRPQLGGPPKLGARRSSPPRLGGPPKLGARRSSPPRPQFGGPPRKLGARRSSPPRPHAGGPLGPRCQSNIRPCHQLGP